MAAHVLLRRPQTTIQQHICKKSKESLDYRHRRGLNNQDSTHCKPHTLDVQVKINRPDKANAMSSSFFVELRDCFERLAVDPSCRAVVLSGAGIVVYVWNDCCCNNVCKGEQGTLLYPASCGSLLSYLSCFGRSRHLKRSTAHIYTLS